MNIRRHFLSNVFRSPDDPAVEPAAGDPPVEPVAGDPPAPPEPSAPVAAEPEAPAAPEPPKPAKTPWWMTRLAEEGAKKTAAEERAAAAERERDNLRARLEAGGAAPAAPAEPVTRQPGQSNEEFAAAVRAEAYRQRVAEAGSNITTRGMREFPDFIESVNTVTAIMNDDGVNQLVQSLMDVDSENAHLIVRQLAKDPDRAVSFTKMNGTQRVAELVRMSTALAPKAPAPAAPAAPAVSRAPKPAPALAPVGDGGGDDPLTSDAGTDDEFYEAWKKKYLGNPRAA